MNDKAIGSNTTNSFLSKDKVSKEYFSLYSGVVGMMVWDGAPREYTALPQTPSPTTDYQVAKNLVKGKS